MNMNLNAIMESTTHGNVFPTPIFGDHERNISNDSGWAVVYSQPIDGMTMKSIVQYKTRLEPLSQRLPNSMYASLIYQMHQTFKLSRNSSPLLQDMKWNGIEFVIAKVRVLKPGSHEEILKNGKPILNGNLKIALTKQRSTSDNELTFFGCNKIQFQDCSYHHNKQAFALEWSFYLANNLEQPVMILVSTPFKVYARKPNKKRKDIAHIDADLQQEDDEMSLKRKRGDNERYYELHLTKHGQQDGVAVPGVDFASVSTRTDQLSPHQDLPIFATIEEQPLKKRAKLTNDADNVNGAMQDNMQRERTPSPTMVENMRQTNHVVSSTNVVSPVVEDESEFHERLGKLLEYIKSHKNMSCVQVVISSMMAVASDIYRETGQSNS